MKKQSPEETVVALNQPSIVREPGQDILKILKKSNVDVSKFQKITRVEVNKGKINIMLKMKLNDTMIKWLNEPLNDQEIELA